MEAPGLRACILRAVCAACCAALGTPFSERGVCAWGFDGAALDAALGVPKAASELLGSGLARD